MEDNNQPQVADTSNAQEASSNSTPSVTEIDGLSEFTFQGERYTPEEWHKTLSEYRQLKESQKETAKYKDYVENYEVDFEKVRKDPSLAAEFKKIYPKQFHAAVDALLGTQRPEASTEAPGSQIPKEILERLNRAEHKLTSYEQKIHEAEVAKNEAYLKTHVDPLFQKYEFADPNVVFAKAEIMIDQGFKMTAAAWERLVKENHLAIEKKAQSIHQRTLKSQLEKGAQGKDVGQGGNAPGNAPPKAPRTFEEATSRMIESMKRAPK